MEGGNLRTSGEKCFWKREAQGLATRVCLVSPRASPEPLRLAGRERAREKRLDLAGLEGHPKDCSLPSR